MEMEHFSSNASDIDDNNQEGTKQMIQTQDMTQKTASNMDELSIDSTTNEKIQTFEHSTTRAAAAAKATAVAAAITEKRHRGDRRQQRHQQQHQRSHFRIDWRQLTYYQKPESCLSRLCGQVRKWSGAGSNSDNTTNAFNADDSADWFSVGGSHKGYEPKRILNSLDGCFKSGELSAILGPSGAGKSTFLSTLFGSKQDGAYGQTKVTWFGEHDDQQPGRKRSSIRIASLPQHDHLLNHLTVYESLMFASKIKNATRPVVGKSFHRQNVKRVAKMLNLTDCLDTRCGRLSGGQYKRVSIGQELLSEPDVIILDEPTSGLDAMTCLTTVQTLKSIVMKHPMSIVLTIHQPDMEVFNLFDHVYVIAQGGMAIYEGPPHNILPTLAQVDLKAPTDNYNPARFIVEHAFVVDSSADLADYHRASSAHKGPSDSSCLSEDDDDDDDVDDDDNENCKNGRERQAGKLSASTNYIRRSVLSLTDAISGKEMASGGGGDSQKRDKKPLLNIGIQTFDGKLITSEQLARNRDQILQSERRDRLIRLNRIQKARYHGISPLDHLAQGDICSSSGSDRGRSPMSEARAETPFDGKADEKSSAKSDYSSSGWSDRKADVASGCGQSSSRMSKATSLAFIPEVANSQAAVVAGAQRKLSGGGGSLQALNGVQQQEQQQRSQQQPPTSDHESMSSSASSSHDSEFVVNFPERTGLNGSNMGSTTTGSTKRIRMKRQFDKRLSAKHNCSKQNDYPVLYHAFLLTHRTWLSIVRDPIFFGIQACMHTIIPVLLALIFGNVQEEGCPQVGNFDLVKFAYSDSSNLIQGTVSSIRQSIGNIGIVFFEMFVLSFSINCITALVFPLDMYVLLKEYRNGWYSLRSYFFGRTLADLPVPIVLHSIGMAILYFLTGQPHSVWRFCAIIALVILASLVAQSVGLTIGAILMKSSQSAVLAAAGIVAPFFALSGFIVRIHTLPLVAQVAAKVSYLYHLLNGFIILRYGFGRCQCRTEDFEPNSGHQIPSNIHTMASMWIGTYSDEYADSSAMVAKMSESNRTNIDPNIDVVDKMLSAFKMANSYGHQIHDCNDVLPYAMLDFNLRDQDIYNCFAVLILMLLVSRFITFTAIYYKIRSFT